MIKLREFFSTQPIEKAWLFGSYSRGEATSQSDIDILVRFIDDTKIGLLYFKIKDDLERMFSSEVDLAEETSLDSHVSDKVNQERILIYERSTAR